MIFNVEETEEDVESQNCDDSNSQREKASKKNDEKKPKTFCKRPEEFIFIKSGKSIICATMITLALTLLAYFGLYRELSKLTIAAKTVTVSSEGPAAENYPESMGQYKIMKDIYRHDRAVYKHVDREDQFIIYTGHIIGVYLGRVHLITSTQQRSQQIVYGFLSHGNPLVAPTTTHPSSSQVPLLP